MQEVQNLAEVQVVAEQEELTQIARDAQTAPFVLDAELLRQIGGGVTDADSPNGGW